MRSFQVEAEKQKMENGRRRTDATTGQNGKCKLIKNHI